MRALGASAASGPSPIGRAVLLSCDACRVGWVLCTPQISASAMSARELWRPCSRETRRSKRSTSAVRGCVLGGWGGGRCGSSLSARDACRVGRVLCTPQTMASATTARELWRPRSRRTRRLWSSVSKVRGSVLGGWEGGDVARSHGRRRPRAAARTMQSEARACAVGRGARAASGPVAGCVAPPCRRVTLAVWVGCCARCRQWHRRRRQDGAGSLAQGSLSC